MNIARESMLSAYLDDQLSPEQRRAVEAALKSDPAVAESLRSLAVVRDLIAELSRPTGPDLFPEIMERLEGRNLERRSGRPATRRLQLAALASGGVAASIACLALLGGRLQPSPRPAPSFTAPSESILADSGPTTDAPSEPIIAELLGPPALPRTAISTGESSPEVASTEQPSADAPASDPDRLLVHELLEGRPPSRVFLVTALDGEATAERVATLLGISTHRNFHRIELPPAEGEVEAEKADAIGAVAFAATLDPAELATFRERLTTAFSERFDDDGEKPAIAADLAKRGRAATLSANPAGDVLIPQTNLALRFQTRERRNWPTTAPDDDRIDARETTGLDAEAAPDGDEASRQPTTETAPTEPGQPCSVLVWIIADPTD